MKATLLVELLTEELPPKSLQALSEAFKERLVANLIKAQLKPPIPQDTRALATPRRLAVLIPEVASQAQDRESAVTGPLAKAPAAALEGFAKKHGLRVEQLERQASAKGEVVLARTTIKGAKLDAVLPGLVAEALSSLPIPKLMRWGDGEAQFVRPVHGLVLLHGSRAIPGAVLGVSAGDTTLGHRFLSRGPLKLVGADGYESLMQDKGRVIVDFTARRLRIESALRSEAQRHGARLGAREDLLDEVTALVEWPAVYAGNFSPDYLQVPQECLILTMQQNQKYFPLFDASGKLLPRFLIVSNMEVADPGHIVGGNERVVRPRLEDARFFYDQDRRQRLEARVPGLAKVVYHNKLGTQLERTERTQLLAGAIARELGADPTLAERAAWLAKADLLTGMVGEFPELQGIMGRYYAMHDGEPAAVADAIEAHYRPRFAGDRLPEGLLSSAVALADKLDGLAGLFSIGEHPTGDKDPFGLRRAALGVVRILIENRLPLRLPALVAMAFEPYPNRAEGQLCQFVYDRLAGYLKEQGFTTLQVDAVLAQQPGDLRSVPGKLEAVKAFQSLPEAESLAAANKRVANILRQAAAKGESFGKVERAWLKEPAEIALFDALRATAGNANRLLEAGDFAGYLRQFAVLKSPVDAFFDKVMVMAEEQELRRNRLALLGELREAMNRVADISKLAA